MIRYPYFLHHGGLLLATGCAPTQAYASRTWTCDRHQKAGTQPALCLGMSKSKRSRRATNDRSVTTDIVSQLECAIRRPQATLIGALVGGLVPWFARTLAHEEVPSTWTSGNHALAYGMLAVVLGCALFSALTVYKFGCATFGDTRKAIGFTLAVEGVMLVSQGATSTAALVVLIVINALANGSTIALARDAACKRREADARRAATRARGRAPRAQAPAPIEVIETPVAATRPRTSRAPGLVKVQRQIPTNDDVIDAEIVSEELFS